MSHTGCSVSLPACWPNSLPGRQVVLVLFEKDMAVLTITVLVVTIK